MMKSWRKDQFLNLPRNPRGPLEHRIVAAKAAAFKEMLDPDFKVYAQFWITLRAIVQVFQQHGNFRVISGGTENHLFAGCDQSR